MARSQRQTLTQTLATEDRRREAARLYREGHTQAAIADRLGVHQGTVSKDLEAVRAEWAAAAAADVGVVKARELAKLDAMEAELWEAWRRSVGEHVKQTRTTTPGPGDTVRVEVSEVREELAGDPRYLAQIRDCVERRCKILGLDAPKELRTSGDVAVKVVSGVDLERV